MKCVKKTLSILVILLVVSVGIALPVNADTYVDVDTTGDVQVIINTDGTVHLIYNGVNIQGEINNLYSVMAYISWQMATLATKTDVNNLNQTVYSLIGELDMVFKDVYDNANFLASIIGISSNSSSVSLNLKSGDYTIVSYLDGILADLYETNTTLTNVRNELTNFENYVDGRFNATSTEIETQLTILGNYVDTQLNDLYTKLHVEVQDLKAYTIELVNGTYIELSERREEMRKDVLADLETLNGLIKEGADRQTITEAYVNNLQQRLYDVENVLGLLVLVSMVLIVALLVRACVRRLKRNPKTSGKKESEGQFGDDEQGLTKSSGIVNDETDEELRDRAKAILPRAKARLTEKSSSSDTTKVRLVKEGDKLRFVKQATN